MKLYTHDEWKERFKEAVKRNDKITAQKLIDSYPDYHCAYIKEQE